jgi:ribonuclease HI
MNVRIFIETSIRGPARRDGIAMWLIECMKGDEPITRQGFVHVRKGTENELALKALINSFFILRKSCSVRVFTQCDGILNTIQNHWYEQWSKNGWINSKGKEVKNKDLWEMLMKYTENHTYTVESGHHEYQMVMQAEITKELERWKDV